MARSEISIHVPTWGTTQFPRANISGIIAFQSTFPRGERRDRVRQHFRKSEFQSTFPRGERPFEEEYIPNDIVFQSTFPRGERQNCSAIRKSSHNFNPRSHVGNDSKFSQIFFAFLCNKYNFSTFYYPFSLFFGVIHFTFLIFAVRILPIFYVYF